MTNLSPATIDLIERQLGWRYATQIFDPTAKIPPREWEVLEQSLLQAPSSFGLQPWRFVVVTDPAIRAELRKHSWDQSQITDASHLIVIASKAKIDDSHVTRLVRRMSAVRGMDEASLDGFKNFVTGFLASPPEAFDIKHWSTHQCYLALGMLLATAANLEIDACPMEGFSPAQYDEILGLDRTEFRSRVACALGYRSPEDPNASMKKVRFEKSEIFSYR